MTTGKEIIQDWIARVKDRHYLTNEWLYADDMQIYVRRSQRLVGICLDIASIEVYNKSQGTFTDFLHYTESVNPWNAVYVESVLNDRLAAFLIRQGM